MGILKKSWLRAGTLTLLGLGMIYGAQSFTEKEEAKEEAQKTELVGEKWFHLKNGGDQTNPADYTLANGNGNSPESCNSGDDEICSIYAQPSSNPTQPNLATVDEEKTIMREATN
ncbi:MULTISPECIES: hypothetical protein [Sphingobacterium]|uniref:hypothetical protein n=1 Tax=Sphingobacterium TaxID=28453 RepID=UPI00257CCC41|nr:MULTISPECIES: hypothetical protein [Sphingobacterium]